MAKAKKFILWLDELSIKDVNLAGGKNASLGEMYRKLTKKGIRIPNGFAISAWAYRFFIKKAGIEEEIYKILKGLDTYNVKDLAKRGKKIRELILGADFPLELEKAIIRAYKKLGSSSSPSVAVRSSATAEDLPTASFAGQQESFLNIRGEMALLKAVKKCLASLFTNRAISYRVDKGFKHEKVALSVGVQKMVRSDKASAGAAFTIDTKTGFSNVVLINSSWGLGESVVKGLVNPDQFYVFKPTLKLGYKPIIEKTLGTKKIKIIYGSKSKPTQKVITSSKKQKEYTLSDREILRLAKWCLLIEKYYKRPMDIEWAKDGLDSQLYIVQARPETVHATKDKTILEEFILKKRGKILCQGESIGSKIGQGRAHIIKSVKQISQFKASEVLVTKITDPDWEPVMKITSAIVTESGGRTSHAAIISRELGIPCVVGTGNATEVIKTGQKVTVSCAEGEKGFVYQGLLPYKIKRTDIGKIKKPKTKIMMNLANPEIAFDVSFIPNDGVGLVRLEFIINDHIKAHPLALLNYQQLKSEDQRQIDKITFGYKNKAQFFVDKLAQGIGRIAAAFYPKDVIVRFSDFKTNEYANLIGGRAFEPEEANPMLGWRGASRYLSQKFRPAFNLECQAIKKVREEMGLVNVKIMIPFCRTPEEGKKVIKILSKNGLKRGKNGLAIYVMCEIPSNIILAKEFAKIFDGFSIGSNDLTQLILGVDRDSALVSHIYDERNKAVKDFIAEVIKTAHCYNRTVSICGQAPSDFPDFAKFLVKSGIDSISLNPDTVLKTF